MQTSIADLDQSLQKLSHGAAQLQSLSIGQRLDLVLQCIAGVDRLAQRWITAACEAKKIDRNSPVASEEITTGPISTIRFLQIFAGTLRDIQANGKPKIPGDVVRVHDQCRVAVFPTPLLYDSILFRPLSAETWLQSEVQSDNLFDQNFDCISGRSGDPKVVVVLGAGNVSSIPATDALTKILIESSAVLLKMNPVNDYLGPIFEDAFKPLIDANMFSVAYGGVGEGEHLINHASTNHVHITGSIHSHDAIVWGNDDQRESRRESGKPQLQKTITSELGNVTPWAIVPGNYTEKQLRFQAEMIATSITNNVSFNCIATKLILTCRGWRQRDRLLEMIDEIFARTQTRHAYYPGAADRFERFSGVTADDPTRLPWTLLTDIDPNTSPYLLSEESFTCVCGELQIDADSAGDFLSIATDWMNDRIWGTLAATLTVTDDFQSNHADELDECFRRLRYGTIGVNIWPALSFALMSPPWGGHPSGTLQDAQSGIGFVHNTYLLKQPEKTILRAPLTMSPKPIWHSNHRHPQRVTADMLKLYARPSLLRLAKLALSSFTG